MTIVSLFTFIFSYSMQSRKTNCFDFVTVHSSLPLIRLVYSCKFVKTLVRKSHERLSLSFDVTDQYDLYMYRILNSQSGQNRYRNFKTPSGYHFIYSVY